MHKNYVTYVPMCKKKCAFIYFMFQKQKSGCLLSRTVAFQLSKSDSYLKKCVRKTHYYLSIKQIVCRNLFVINRLGI